jgi:hypothetical protein
LKLFYFDIFKILFCTILFSISKYFSKVFCPSLVLSYFLTCVSVISVKGNKVVANVNGATVLSVVVKQLPSQRGFVALGPDSFGVVHFDNLSISRADRVTLCKSHEDESPEGCFSVPRWRDRRNGSSLKRGRT